MELPPLGPVAPGRSALPAFLPVEEGLVEALEAARAEADARRAGAEAEAARIRAEGEARLKDVILEAEAQALREVEGRVRDRVSAARAAVERWIDAAEAASRDAVAEALERIAGA